MDTKQLLTTLADKFEANANEQLYFKDGQTLTYGQDMYEAKANVWKEAADELREALADEETVKPVAENGFKHVAQMSERDVERLLTGELANTPLPTNTEIVGIVAKDVAEYRDWTPPDYSDVILITPGVCMTVRSGKRYIYIDTIDNLRGLELTGYEELPGAKWRSGYRQLISAVRSRVRRQVTK